MKQLKHLPILIFSVLIVFAAIALSFIRIFLGTEITDEAFYTAEAMLVNQGATPFVDNWTQAPGATLLYAPLVKLYQWFVPNMEGVFLYMRIAFWIYRLGICVWISYLFRKSGEMLLTVLSTVPLLLFFYSVLPAFSYTSIPISFLLIASILLIYRITQYNRDIESNISCFCGILMALVTFCSPAQVVNCIVFLMLIRCYLPKSWKQDTIKYVSGGLIIAVILSCYLIVKAGSISALLHSLEVMLFDNPYFALGSAPMSLIIDIIVGWGRYAIDFYLAGIIVATFFYGFMRLLKIHRGKICLADLVKAGTVFGMFSGLTYTIWKMRGLLMVTNSTMVLFVGVLICRLVCKDCKALNRAFDMVAIPEIVTLVIMAFTVYGGISSRFYVVFPMGLFCIPYGAKIMKNLKSKYSVVSLPFGFSAYFTIGMCCLCVMVGAFFNFQFFYRETDENDFYNMNYRIPEGVYKGIYSTEQRGKSLVALERYIKENVKLEESVLFMEVVPMAYLMTDASFCTPSTWDIMLYSYGFNDDTMMQEYFKIVEKIPDKIIYIDTGRDEMLSIEKEGYHFNDFVNENYIRVDTEENIPDFRIVVYKKSNWEIEGKYNNGKRNV